MSSWNINVDITTLIDMLDFTKFLDPDFVNPADVPADLLTIESLLDVVESPSSSSPDDSLHTESVVPMFDRTRLGMCFLMMSFFVFDPFNFFFARQLGKYLK